MANVANRSDSISNEFTRRVFIPGIATILTVWLVQSGITQLDFPTLRSQSAFARLLLLHLDMKIAFAVAGIVSVLYGELVASSLTQRFLSVMFPGFFEILKWVWMLLFPLPSWIDPARQVYRFSTLSIGVNTGFWLIHIVIPTAMGAAMVALSNRRVHFRANPDLETGS